MEFVIVIMTAFVLPITIVGMILRFMEQKRKDSLAAGAQSDQSLTTSELQDLIEESVSNATALLSEQVQSIDEELRQLKLQLPDDPTDGIKRIGTDLESDHEATDLQVKSLGRSKTR